MLQRTLILALALAALPACAANRAKPLSPPNALIAPYDTSAGTPVWAVIPLRNESGTSLPDPLDVSDRLVNALAQVQGIHTLPLNRSLAALDQLGITNPESPQQLRQIAELLGADALVVGSITAWNPYNPPTIGLALALYVPSSPLGRRTEPLLDPRTLVYQPTDYHYFANPSLIDDQPASVVSQLLDARNHDVLLRLQNYAAGRADPDSPYGWRIYLVSMDHYADFAAWAAAERLLQHEWIRLAAPDHRTARH